MRYYGYIELDSRIEHDERRDAGRPTAPYPIHDMELRYRIGELISRAVVKDQEHGWYDRPHGV